MCHKKVKAAPLYRLLKSADPEEDDGVHRAARVDKRSAETCADYSSCDSIMCNMCYGNAPGAKRRRRR